MSLYLDDYLSKKLQALSFGAIVLVVFIHSYNAEVKFVSGEIHGGQSYFVLFIENFISKGIGRIAVPLFFAISGFLFYKSFELTVTGVLNKLKSRFKTLLIPYLFWSVFGLILILFLQLIPLSKNFFTKELITHYSVSKLLFTILFDPIPYQLWFVRDLIMLTIWSPLIWYLTKSTRGAWLVILAFLWIKAPKTFELFSNEALFFFTLGCALAIENNDLVNHRFSKYLSYCLLVLWLLIVLLAAYLFTFNRAVFFLNALNNLGIVIGVISVWSLYDHFNQEYIARYSFLFGYSFFIFVFHEPLLTVLKKGMFFLIGKTNFSSFLIYVVAPVIAIIVSMLVCYFFKWSAPRLYNIATGGR